MFSFLRVDAEAVVCAVGDHSIGTLVSVMRDLQRGYLLFYALTLHLAARNRTDDPIAVAGRLEINRNGSCHDKPLFNGLVTVAVAHRHVSWSKTRLHDSAVGTAGSGDHGVTAVGSES